MKTVCGILCFLLLSQGVGGLLHEWTDGWFELWSVVARMSYFDGYEIYVSVVLIVAGLGMGAATESAKKRGL